MKIITILLIVIIIYIYFIVNRNKKLDKLNAGKKWESIIKELSERK